MKGRLVYHEGVIFYQYPTSDLWHLARVQGAFDRMNLVFINCRVYRIHKILHTPEPPWEYIEEKPEQTCRRCDPIGIYERKENGHTGRDQQREEAIH